MKTKTIRAALAAAICAAATPLMATDLDNYRFRYDFSSGAKQFYGSSDQTTDPLLNSSDASDMTALPVTGPDGEGSAVHPMNTAWSSVNSTTFYGVLNADWTWAMSVRPGSTQNGVLFSIGRKNVDKRKNISICASSDPTKLLVDENKRVSSTNKNSLETQIELSNGVDVSCGFHTVVVVYKMPASGNAGTLDFYVDGVYQRSLTTIDYGFGGAFQFCTTCSGNTTDEVSTTSDQGVAFRDVRFYSSAFSSADVKKYAALYPADTLRPSASIRAYGVNCIDTGYLVKPTTYIATDFQYTETPVQARIFGERGALGCHLYINTYGEYSCLLNDNNLWSNSAFGSNGSGSANVNRAFVWIDRPSGKANLKQYRPSRNINETLSGTCTNTAEITLPLFADYTATATQNFSKAFIYSIDIHEGGTPVHFFAPHKDATLGACFKDVITGELKGESRPSPSTALSYTEGFGSSADYKYEGGVLYAKVYVSPSSAAAGSVAVLCDGGNAVVTPEAEGYYWIAYGTELTLSATPESGYLFTKWIGDTRILKSGSAAANASIVVTIDKASQFEARFTPNEIYHASDGGYAATGERSAATTEDPNDVDLVVAENAYGFEGVEAAGAYAVNGSHSFSAGSAASGVFGGTAVGYKLERWNRDSKTWEFASYGGGNTFAYTNCAANGRMRLTWFWQQTGQVRKYGATDYIQYGGAADLLAHFDGILNAGADAEHETSPSEWVDLTGNFNLATNKAPAFIGDAWRADGASYFATNSTAVMNALKAKAFTLEMMISNPGGQAKNSYEYWTAMGNDASHRQLVVDLRQKNSTNPLVQGVQYRESGWVSRSQLATSSITEWNKRQYIAVVCDSTGATTYCDGTNQIHHTNGGAVDPSQPEITVGAGFDGGSPLYAGSEICAMRMTAAAMPLWQIEYNNSVDHVRFCGNVTVVNGAVGETGQTGASSVEDGTYDLASGTWEITASSVTVDGRTYSPRLLVETYNASTGEWTANTAKPLWSRSYVVDKEALGDSRIRLTWVWGVQKGMTIIVK